MKIRCICCGSEAIYYRDSLICCVNPSCRKEFTIDDYYENERKKAAK